MKAYEVIVTDGITWRKDSNIFKHYENALKFRMRKRANNMSSWHSEKRFWKSRYADKISNIKTIEVADDYWKKDFGKYLSIGYALWIWKKPKTTWRQDYTETEHLSHTLYWIHYHIRTSSEIDKNNEDVKFMLEDLQRYNETSLPKNVKLEQQKELFFFCWKTLLKLWYEWFISEKDRWMYEDEFNEYCERMEKLQEELVAEMK